jgi:hypothetical protein
LPSKPGLINGKSEEFWEDLCQFRSSYFDECISSKRNCFNGSKIGERSFYELDSRDKLEQTLDNQNEDNYDVFTHNDNRNHKCTKLKSTKQLFLYFIVKNFNYY